MTTEFVVFDANNKEVDWVDPVMDYYQLSDSVFIVDNGFAEYKVHIPDGGSWTIRPRKEEA